MVFASTVSLVRFLGLLVYLPSEKGTNNLYYRCVCAGSRVDAWVYGAKSCGFRGFVLRVSIYGGLTSGHGHGILEACTQAEEANGVGNGST